MRIILFSLIVFSSFAFVGCTPMNSEKSTMDTYEIRKDSSLIKLVQKIHDADTILLTSHTGITFDTTGGKTKGIYAEMLIGNKINRKIIKEQKIIIGSDIDRLISIMSIPKPDVDSLTTTCWDPHHCIFIVKDEKISYIDICFHCAGIAMSNDLEDIRPFGESKWMKLLRFFKSFKLEYKLPSTILPKDE